MNSRTRLSVVSLIALAGTVACGPASYSTEFDVTESPVSENAAWHHTGLDWTTVASSNGMAYGTQTGNGGFDDSYAYLSGFSADQTASGIVHIDPGINTGTTHEVEILLRWADSEHSARGYECNFAYDGQYADIVRWNGPKDSFTYLLPTLSVRIPGGLHEGDTVGASIVGTTITTYLNGTPLATVADSVFTDGNPGIGFFRGAPSAPQNDFAFTQFAARSIVPPAQ